MSKYHIYAKENNSIQLRDSIFSSCLGMRSKEKTSTWTDKPNIWAN